MSAYTRGAAFAERAETEKGTLAPGMQADLAVLTQDIFTIAPDQLPATEAWMTIVGGEIVHAVTPFDTLILAARVPPAARAT